MITTRRTLAAPPRSHLWSRLVARLEQHAAARREVAPRVR